MKKIVLSAIILGSSALFVSSAEAKTPTADIGVASSSATVSVQKWRRHDRGVRTSITTRIVRRGFVRYRETIRVTRYPNGRVVTNVIRRERIR